MSFFSKLKEVFVSNTPDTSASKTLNKTDVAKVLRNALMVGGAAMVTYFSENLTSINFGQFLEAHVHIMNAAQWNAILVPVIAGGLDMVHKYFKGTPEVVEGAK